MAGPLDGVRILDMSTVGMGPMATQMLGDMGADVIKVEPPAGDVFRHVTPQRHAGMSHAHLNLNRNKRSVVLDAKTPRGLEALLELIAGADVFVSNMRAPALRRLGLDHETLAPRFPRLIHCVCYGYSERGPYAGRPAIDDTIQAASGLAWLQGAGGAEPPRYVNSVVADKTVALYVSNAIACALYARERTGTGQSIEVPMFECMVAFLAPEHLAGRSFVPAEGEAGYARLLNDYRRPFATRDGYLSVVPYTDAQWRRFFALAGDPGMADDPRYCTARDRSRHFPELYRYVEDTLRTRTTAQWLAALETADIPFAPVHSFDDLLADPHLAALGFWRECEHPTEGRLRQAGIPVHFGATPGDVRRHAPGLGEHTEEVLGGRTWSTPR
ncbi:CoA transferase [Pigmentiphaga sp. GD03639]|uniref:CoA transferase n=1 Tax=Pigmentiphaga daeguensis TaxID=414049 RepID=A0ABN1BR42_9BURK|nr:MULTISPECIES: CoA transferase [unclassified Pigmentiphaga]MDH2236251.1 CoA transferase [Pigmentiphaga sp. GD03639]OVZ64538.1 CoA transferase [Pigmentiphaga sp. NML030171]